MVCTRAFQELTHTRISPFPLLHRRVDTYSFGVVISEVKSRELPFADVPRNQKTGFNPPLIRAIKAGDKRPRNDESWGAEIFSLIDRCTRHSPAERPPFGEVAGILKQLYEDCDKTGDGGVVGGHGSIGGSGGGGAS